HFPAWGEPAPNATKPIESTANLRGITRIATGRPRPTATIRLLSPGGRRVIAVEVDARVGIGWKGNGPVRSTTKLRRANGARRHAHGCIGQPITLPVRAPVTIPQDGVVVPVGVHEGHKPDLAVVDQMLDPLLFVVGW